MRKHVFVIIGLIIFSALLSLIRCEREDINEKEYQLKGEIINITGCNYESKSLVSSEVISDSMSCVEYSYNSIDNRLILRHINSGFNCCPDSLYIQASLKGDTIIVREFEAKALCRCNCLYDLEIEIEGVYAKKYKVRFIEPYADKQSELIFETDLAENNEGTFCVVRKQYPWGI